MRAFLHRFAAAYGSAIILMFFSEYYFLNEGPVVELLTTLKTNPVLAIPAFVSFAGFYTFFTYPMLMALSYFNVRTLSGLLLAGALFGWATEGLTVPVVYESIPVSFVFPSIGWHALIDVMAGWYLVRLAMRRFGPLGNGIMFVVLGIAWGAWATWFWGAESEMAPLLPADFVLLAMVASGFWFLGMLLADRFGTADFVASRWEVVFVIVVSLGLFVMISYPFLPLSLLIVPMVGMSIFALWRAHKADKGQLILAQLGSQTPGWWTYFMVLLTPMTAVPVYFWFFTSNMQVPTEAIVVSLLLIGVVWYVIALIAPFVARSK